MDQDLRNGLWNALSRHYWSLITPRCNNRLDAHSWLQLLCTRLWEDFFKQPLEGIDNYWPHTLEKLRKYFFSCAWFEVYDFIEFVAHHYEEPHWNDQFMKRCNEILERELSGYRFVSGLIAPVTTKEEVAQIEKAIQASPGPVQEHLNQSLKLLSDRTNPDFRNSIKEAVSAVEAACSLMSGEKSTLADALKKITANGSVPLHPALAAAFIKLYGYSSDAEGIRHALMDEPNLTLDDAMFMLVACSAFINYIRVKASKAGKAKSA